VCKDEVVSYPNRPVRLLLGALSVAPFLIMVSVFGSALVSAIAGRGSGLLADDSDAGFFLFLTMTVGLGLFSVALVGYYVFFIFCSERVRAEDKALWAIVLFMGNVIGIPIFWFVYFWRDAEMLAKRPTS
jgi:hypothetical protein